MQKSTSFTEKAAKKKKKKKSYQFSLSSSGSHLLQFANKKDVLFYFNVKGCNNRVSISDTAREIQHSKII